MRSLRVDPELDARIERAAAIRGESVSEFLRNAAAARADSTLDGAEDAELASVLGAVHGGGGRARHSGASFAQALHDDVRGKQRTTREPAATSDT